MNKTRISACAALIAGLFILNAPLDAAVESPVVGYTTIDIPAGFTMVSVPFDPLVGDEGISVQGIAFGQKTFGDNIQYWDGSKLVGLMYRDSVPAYTGWQESFNVLSTKKFKPGEAFWINAQVATQLIASGQLVPVGETSTTNTGLKITLISSPLPVACNIQDITIDGVAFGDNIQYWDGNKLVGLIYRDSVPAYTGWQSSFNTLSTKEFQPGEGFYLFTQNDVTVTFPDPRNP